MRPSNKEITQNPTDATRDSISKSNYETVRQLMKAGHNCLSCTHFDVETSTSVSKCRSKKRSHTPFHTKWYNICHYHVVPSNVEQAVETVSETKETI